MSGPFPISANMSILYGDLERDRRPAAAAEEGYKFVESWWPFATAAADRAEMEAFCRAVRSAGVRLVALNLDAGDIAGGDRGLLSIPSHAARVTANLASVAEVVERAGCQVVNALYGNREPGVDEAEQDRIALEQAVRVADRLGDQGVTVVIETLNLVDSPKFPLTDIADTASFVRRANQLSRHENVRLLLDTYHLATMGTDPAGAVREYGSLVGHVQFADFPGRGRPGTGRIDFSAVEQELLSVNYDGYVAYEYNPAFAPHHEKEGIV